MKKLAKSKIDKKTTEAVPAANKTAVQKNPTPHDPKSDPGTGDSAQAVRDDGAVRQREHANAVEAERQPVQAPRSQDADPNANKGVTITTEAGTPVAHPGSTLR